MLCPFFRKTCLKKDCTAYSLKNEEAVADFINITIKMNVPYCNALKIFLPELKGEN